MGNPNGMFNELLSAMDAAGGNTEGISEETKADAFAKTALAAGTGIGGLGTGAAGAGIGGLSASYADIAALERAAEILEANSVLIMQQMSLHHEMDGQYHQRQHQLNRGREAASTLREFAGSRKAKLNGKSFAGEQSAQQIELFEKVQAIGIQLNDLSKVVEDIKNR